MQQVMIYFGLSDDGSAPEPRDLTTRQAMVGGVAMFVGWIVSYALVIKLLEGETWTRAFGRGIGFAVVVSLINAGAWLYRRRRSRRPPG